MQFCLSTSASKEVRTEDKLPFKLFKTPKAHTQKSAFTLFKKSGTRFTQGSPTTSVSLREDQQKLSDFSEESINEWLIDGLLANEDLSDPIVKAAHLLINDGKMSHFKFLLTLFDALYTVGAVGIKTDTSSPENWSYYSDHSPSEGSIKPSSVIKLHPTFWRAVGARPS